MTTAAFAVRWTPTARRDLARLPEKIATVVVEFVYGSLAANPDRVGRPLHLELAGAHAARRGDYRVIYRIEHAERAVVILHIDHRADVYRKT
ncbi:MAG TPA: type II toxin-antitoxin system RelE/ParE family toxin [Mycobacteriales bacterium]|nr:type II toxin-antitoxin system RelE/ParE family toxin [Mycobacteriales bacterium]